MILSSLGVTSKAYYLLNPFFHSQFHMKDLRMLKYLLGVETRKLGAKPCSTPMAPNVQLTKEGELFEDPERHRRLVGKLNYLIVTRSHIAYLVSVLSRCMSSPTSNHWAAVEHILCYLKEALGHGILYKKHAHTRIECFFDIDWAGSKEDRRSTSEYCVFFWKKFDYMEE